MKTFNSVEELVKYYNKDFHMFIKFGSKDNLERLQSGQLYMKNILYYNTLESEGLSGKPDKYDGKTMLEGCTVVIKNTKNHEIIAECSSAKVVFSYDLERCPIFCLFCLDERNFGNYIIDENKCITPISFTFTQTKQLEESLGEYALIILNTTEFLKRLDDTFKENNIKYTRKLVSYNKGNSKERIQSIKSNELNIAFNKEPTFAYQQEFRYLIENKDVEDHFILTINDLHDISKIVPTKELVNYKINLSFIINKFES